MQVNLNQKNNLLQFWFLKILVKNIRFRGVEIAPTFFAYEGISFKFSLWVSVSTMNTRV